MRNIYHSYNWSTPHKRASLFENEIEMYGGSAKYTILSVLIGVGFVLAGALLNILPNVIVFVDMFVDNIRI